ncbi:MAG: 4-hydroxy-3-methylbut-2-enyl diphosphate reductase [Candidatus Gastranaerophilales bacterium]
MPKDINIAKYAGFCYGVKRAVETVKKLKIENPDKNIFILGELIHNAHVINELSELGIKTVSSIKELEGNNGICVIRSHGESPEIIEEIQQLGFELIDLTCPDVKKVQQKAVEMAQNDDFVIIVGKAQHPEVIAIKANAQRFSEKVIVAANIEELFTYEQDIKSHKKVGVVVQTTQTISTLNSIVEYLIPISKELHIANTICTSTSIRQNEAKKLAQNSKLMVVVGSKKSANTTHLTEILSNITDTIHIENVEELQNYTGIIEASEKISITAGASTPQKIIDNVFNKIRKEH